MESYDVIDISKTESINNSSLAIVSGSDAVIEALKNFLTSSKYDFPRTNLNSGNIKSLLLKPINSVDDESIKDSLYNAITKYFEPKLTILALDITTDMEERRRYITIKFFAPSLNIIGTMKESIGVN